MVTCYGQSKIDFDRKSLYTIYQCSVHISIFSSLYIVSVRSDSFYIKNGRNEHNATSADEVYFDLPVLQPWNTILL